jgi:hypothetical protein
VQQIYEIISSKTGTSSINFSLRLEDLGQAQSTKPLAKSGTMADPLQNPVTRFKSLFRRQVWFIVFPASILNRLSYSTGTMFHLQKTTHAGAFGMEQKYTCK